MGPDGAAAETGRPGDGGSGIAATAPGHQSMLCPQTNITVATRQGSSRLSAIASLVRSRYTVRGVRAMRARIRGAVAPTLHSYKRVLRVSGARRGREGAGTYTDEGVDGEPSVLDTADRHHPLTVGDQISMTGGA